MHSGVGNGVCSRSMWGGFGCRPERSVLRAVVGQQIWALKLDVGDGCGSWVWGLGFGGCQIICTNYTALCDLVMS